MSFKSFVLLLSLAASVSAISTPHAARNHRGLAARVANVAPLEAAQISVRKRADGKRCRPRPTSKAAENAAPSPTVVVPTTTPKPVTTPKPEPTTTKAVPTTTPEPAPKPTTTPAAEPKPTTTPKPEPKPTTTKEAPAPAPTPKPPTGGPSFLIGTQTGQGTFYATGLGACGIVNKDTDYIAAVSHLLFDAFPGYNGVNPNNNPMCGRKVRVSFQGKSVTVALTDRCEACSLTDLDFSPSAFSQLSDFGAGRISNIQWVWI